MAGHSQFKNIMHRKNRQDLEKSKIFSKISREITIASRNGGQNPSTNPRLRIAIQNAKIQSMPKNNIKRAIDIALNIECNHYEEIRYDGYGPEGISIIVETLTDNKNRTASNIRSIFTKYHVTLCETGSSNFLFHRIGQIIYQVNENNFEEIIEKAIEIGAQDININRINNTVSIFCSTNNLKNISKNMLNIFGIPENVKIIWIPKNYIHLKQDKKLDLLDFVNLLKEDEDVQNVYTNFLDENLLR